MKKTNLIAIIGPESSGKSELTNALSQKFSGEFVEEYARKYLEENGTTYSLQDINKIAEFQWKNEQEGILSSNSNFLFFDTNLDVLRVWEEVVFDTCDLSILKKISRQNYDAYLLCYPDLPWEYDPQRELPDEKDRLRIFDMYLEIVIDSNIPFYIVKGNGKERIADTIKFIEKRFTLD